MGPLDGVRVVEIASLAPAPFGCMVLADMGAEVLRVQRTGPPADGLSPPPGPLDRGRHSIAVDLKNPAGVAVVEKLIESADIFVEGFRPGVAERLGVGPDRLCELNPRLVYARMTGWGQDGPLAHRAGHDINYIAVAGALEPIGRRGERPVPPLNLLGDFGGGGMLLALGVIAALYERERSGRGQVIDAAMVDGAALLTTFVHGMHAAGMWSQERGVNPLDGAAPFYDTYETADGRYVAVGCVEYKFYLELLDKLGIEDEELPFQLDASGWPQLKKLIADVIGGQTRDHWAEVFADSDACVSPVVPPWEAHLHPHNAARRSFIEIDGIVQPAPAPRFSRSIAADPSAMDDEGRDPAAALARWGLSADQADALVTSGTVA